jgi:hypothetical protein
MSNATFNHHYIAVNHGKVYQEKDGKEDCDFMMHFEKFDFGVETADSTIEKDVHSVYSIHDVDLIEDSSDSEMASDCGEDLFEKFCEEYDREHPLPSPDPHDDGNEVDIDSILDDNAINRDIASFICASKVSDDDMEGLDVVLDDEKSCVIGTAYSTGSTSTMARINVARDTFASSTTPDALAKVHRVTPPAGNVPSLPGQLWAFRNMHGLDHWDCQSVSGKPLWATKVTPPKDNAELQLLAQYHTILGRSVRSSPHQATCRKFARDIFAVTEEQGWPLERNELAYYATVFSQQYQKFFQEGKPNQVTFAFIKVKGDSRSLANVLRTFYKTKNLCAYSQPRGINEQGSFGILVAMTGGAVARIETNALGYSSHLDTAVLNSQLKTILVPASKALQNDVILIRNPEQCLPLLCYNTDPLYERDYTAIEKLDSMKKKVAEVVDSYFNHGLRLADREVLLEHLVNPLGDFPLQLGSTLSNMQRYD